MTLANTTITPNAAVNCAVTILLVRKSVDIFRGLSQKPILAIVLSVIGGLLNIGMLRSIVPNMPWGVLNAFWPLVPLVGGTMLYVSPRHHRIWGALILGFCIASWVLLGSLLGDIGGLLAIKWNQGKTSHEQSRLYPVTGDRGAVTPAPGGRP
jgi:hypothetical protein